MTETREESPDPETRGPAAAMQGPDRAVPVRAVPNGTKIARGVRATPLPASARNGRAVPAREPRGNAHRHGKDLPATEKNGPTRGRGVHTIVRVRNARSPACGNRA